MLPSNASNLLTIKFTLPPHYSCYVTSFIVSHLLIFALGMYFVKLSEPKYVGFSLGASHNVILIPILGFVTKLHYFKFKYMRHTELHRYFLIT